MARCYICGKRIKKDDQYVFGTCLKCRRKMPESLLKACDDYPFTYALGLRDGTKLLFSGAEIQGEWATLEGIYPYGKDENSFIDVTSHGADSFQEKVPFGKPYPRGIDVRIADIVWCADAPDAS